MSKLTLGQWLERLELLHPCEIDLGLERVSAVAHSLQLLPLQYPVISIAGTNGKGSTVAVIEAVMAQTSCKTGSCTSPHLLRFNERIRIAGVEASDEDIVSAFEQIDIARGDTSLTYFEFATLAALLVFRLHEIELAVLEVGLGGRLDAVNIVDADVGVITSIDLDHQNWLGDTRELIALEKAGILRSGKPAVIAEKNPPATLCNYIEELGCKPCYSGRDYHLEEGEKAWNARLLNQDETLRRVFEMPQSSILADNICAALQALLLNGKSFTDDQLRSALAGLNSRGRREMQEIAGRRYLLDVAHNEASVNKLLEYIDLTRCNSKVIALFSSMKDKDNNGIIEVCMGRFDAWFTADQASNPRAAKGADIAEALYSRGERMVSVSKNIRQALRRAQQLMSEGDTLVVFGSFYTVAEVMPLLDKDRRKEVALSR